MNASLEWCETSLMSFFVFSADVDSCSTDSEDECGIGFVRINGSSLREAVTFDGGSGEHDCIDAPTGCDDVITKTASAALDKTSSPSGTGDTQGWSLKLNRPT